MTSYPQKYSGSAVPPALVALCQRLVPLLIEGAHPAMKALQEQYRGSRIKEVELTGAGFYIHFDVPPSAPLAPLVAVLAPVRRGSQQAVASSTTAGERWASTDSYRHLDERRAPQ